MAGTLTASSVRAALSRKAFLQLREALGASTGSLARLWPELSPLERAACWRLLPARALPAAVRALRPAARWQAFLSAPIECLAPLLEDAPLGARKFFRAPTRREAALLRAELAR